MNFRTRTIERLRDALLRSGRRRSDVETSAHETLARAGLLTLEEKTALARVDAVAETLFLMMAADEMVADTELAAIRGAIRGLTGDVLGDGVIKVMIETYALRLRDQGRTARLQAITTSLRDKPEEAESAFTMAAAVALADDEVATSEDTLLTELANWFGFSPERTKSLLEQLSSDASES